MRKIISLFFVLIMVLNSVSYASMPCCQNNDKKNEIIQTDSPSHTDCHSQIPDDTNNNDDDISCNHGYCSMCIKPISLNIYHYDTLFVSSVFIADYHNISPCNQLSLIEQPPKVLLV